MSRLKDLRKERGYTQIKMQHLTGIDQSDYSKIENGKRYYTFEQCRKIALALGTSWTTSPVSRMKGDLPPFQFIQIAEKLPIIIIMTGSSFVYAHCLVIQFI